MELQSVHCVVRNTTAVTGDVFVCLMDVIAICQEVYAHYTAQNIYNNET